MLISFFSNNSANEGKKSDLAGWITKSGSKQTYYTLRFLADGDRLQDALRGYAYFRWVDDQLDCSSGSRDEKLAFVTRQRALLEACYHHETPETVSGEEQMLVDLVRNNPENDSGLSVYLYHMMDVMQFDFQRCGKLISQAELARYSLMLSKAVTEYMFYFIGHNDPSPHGPARYQAVIGAHVVHMLRDLSSDIEVGYYNFPLDLDHGEKITQAEINSDAFRQWVYQRVQFGHKCFTAGREFISGVKNLRCRLAGFAYLARFEWMLRAIEKDQYCLRPAYPERKKIRVAFWMAWYVLAGMLKIHKKDYEPVELDLLARQCEEQ
jgi:hypothetical protein